eukprot:TRINITY_DN5875_c0_g1_i1.p1 TRINITY_DN5875_c0_g1~~TRINITY_DN5875_c0_g1_i1.p1  ORF type:complete len:181 (+),score=14.65 TRINITY_DN5875_c0_g1_i1:338-880(+)
MVLYQRQKIRRRFKHSHQKNPFRFVKKMERMFTVEDAQVANLVNLFRALGDSNYPPATFALLANELELVSFIKPEICSVSAITELLEKHPPGTIAWKLSYDPDGVFIKCKDGIVKSSGFMLLPARKESREIKIKNFLRRYISDKKVATEGCSTIFSDAKPIEGLTLFRTLLDKKYEYLND